MRPTLDLTTQAWIPTVRLGATRQLGLRNVLVHAHEIDELSDPISIVEFGLYRFLTALVMDVFAISEIADLAELLAEGNFDETRIDDYFAKWGNRFDLFDERYPFLQTAGMADEPDKPLAAILPPVPSGTAANFFHHYSEGDFGVSPTVAARLLTSVAPFMTAGGAGLAPSINGSPPWYVLVRGESLFQTICLNIPVLLHKELSGTAPPAWRNPEPPSTQRCTQTSLLEALTWQPRRIQLVPGGPGTCSVTGAESPVIVSKMKFKAGASCDLTWFDPSVPYKINEKGALVMRPQEGKAVWRDTGPLLLLRERDYRSADGRVKFSRPAVIDQLAKLVEYGAIDRRARFSVSVYGMRTDMKMKVFEWQREQLSVRMPLVLGSPFVSLAQSAIEDAGRVEYQLSKAIKRLYRDDGKGNPKAFDTIIANARREYWGLLRPDYDEILREMADAAETDESDRERHRIVGKWHEIVKKHVLGIFHRVSWDMDADRKALRRLMEAERNLSRGLFFALQSPEERQASIKSKRGKPLNDTQQKGGLQL